MADTATELQTPTETVTLPASEAAIVHSGSSLSDGVEEYRQARLAERIGKPKDPVALQVTNGQAIDAKTQRREQRRAKQEEVNEGARKAAQRVVDDFDTQVKERDERIKALELELAAARRPASPGGSVVAPAAVSTPVGGPSQHATDDPEPNPQDLTKYPSGEFDPKYIRDAAAWDNRQYLVKRERETLERSQREHAQKDYESTKAAFFTERDAEVAKDPTFQDVITATASKLFPVEEFPTLIAANIFPKDAKPGPENYLASTILRSPQRIALLRHIHANPTELNRLLVEGPPAFHRLEGQLAALSASSSSPAPAPSPKTHTDAPPPPPTLGTRVTTPADPIAAAAAKARNGLTDGVREYREARRQERVARAR